MTVNSDEMFKGLKMTGVILNNREQRCVLHFSRKSKEQTDKQVHFCSLH